MMESHFTAEFWEHVESHEGATEKEWEQRIVETVTEFYEHGHRELGRGQSGFVWTGSAPEVKDGLCFKTIHTTGIDMNSLEEEFRLHEEAQKAGVRVPKLLGFIQTPPDSKFGNHGLVVMEQVHGRNLEEEIEFREKNNMPWTPEEFMALSKAIGDNVERMNEHNLYHRDLHLRNIMVTEEGIPYIIDFGRGRQTFSSEDETTIYQGTIYQNGKRITLSLLKDEYVRVTFALEVKKRGLISAPALDKIAKV